MPTFCAKCGRQVDANTGLCTVCDADALYRMQMNGANVSFNQNSNNQPPKKSSRAVLIIILVVLILILVAGVVFGIVYFAMDSHGKNDSASSKMKDVRSSYAHFMNLEVLPDVGRFDFNNPKKSPNGVKSAILNDLNHDKMDEFVIVYSETNEGYIDTNVSCYEYDDSDDIEEIGTITVDSVPDYTVDDYEACTSYEDVIYSVEHDGVTYIIYEHISWLQGYSYDAHVFTMVDGEFVEVSNINVPDIGSDGTAISYSTMLPKGMDVNSKDFDFKKYDPNGYIKEQFASDDEIILFYTEGGGSSVHFDKHYSSTDESVSAFFACYGIKRSVAVEYGREDTDDRRCYIARPEGVNYIYSGVYYVEHDFENDKEIEHFEFNDFTNWEELLKDTDTADGKDKAEKSDNTIPDKLTDADIKSFEKMMDDSSYCWIADCVDFDTMTVDTLIHGFIVEEGIHCGMYRVYFGTKPDDFINNYKDPKGKFVFSYRLDADKVDWILENVFDRKPDRKSSGEHYYYDGDNVYVWVSQGGGMVPHYKVEKYNYMGDGKFSIDVNALHEDDNSIIGRYNVIASPQVDKNGKKYWKLYGYSYK